MVETIQTDKYPDTILDIVRSIANNRIHDSREWINGVKVLDDFTIPYHDSGYLEEKQKLLVILNKKNVGCKPADISKNEIEYWRNLLKELLLLVGRSGFLEVRYMDGVITEEDMKEAEKV